MTESCWIWNGTRNASGYGVFVMEGKRWFAHRLSAHLSGLDPTGVLVCHKCDNPPCVNPSHLFLGANLDNVRDMMTKGRGKKASGLSHGSKTMPERWARGDRNGSRLHIERMPRGSDHKLSKLTEETVLSIRKRFAEGECVADIARSINLNWSTVERACRGKSWRHVPVE